MESVSKHWIVLKVAFWYTKKYKYVTVDKKKVSLFVSTNSNCTWFWGPSFILATLSLSRSPKNPPHQFQLLSELFTLPCTTFPKFDLSERKRKSNSKLKWEFAAECCHSCRTDLHNLTALFPFLLLCCWISPSKHYHTQNLAARNACRWLRCEEG